MGCKRHEHMQNDAVNQLNKKNGARPSKIPYSLGRKHVWQKAAPNYLDEYATQNNSIKFMQYMS